MKLAKRKRRYRCKHCGQTVLRVSDKEWIMSACVRSDDKLVRLVRVK